jgi:hypothetical protein
MAILSFPGSEAHLDKKGGPKNHYLSDLIGDPVAAKSKPPSACAKANQRSLRSYLGCGRVNRIVSVGRHVILER